ncbi:MAG TPA: PTS sugar transporter subunit IIA [Pirellulaceae bacterium]|nr:PTS sugar transporter subunit IIA [Pirellulaceae bacterium]
MIPGEFFSLSDLARFLRKLPDEIQKMAERGLIPGRKISGQWRFERSEVFHWLETQMGISDAAELKRMQQALDSTPNRSLSDQPDWSLLVRPELCLIPCRARSKPSLIRDFCEFLAQTGRLWEPDKMADAIRSREDLHPTALESGVALLHPRRPQPAWIDEPFVALAITLTGIPFGGPRGSLTDIFFLLASNDDAFHLKVLARISRLVTQASFVESLRGATDGALACKIIHQFAAELE